MGGLEKEGIHKQVFESIMKCDDDTRQDLLWSVILSGSNSIFPGMAERLKKDISALASPSMTVSVSAPPDRANAFWMGGSILSSLRTFGHMWVYREEYDEDG